MEIWNVNIFYQFVGKGGLAGDGVQVEATDEAGAREAGLLAWRYHEDWIVGALMIHAVDAWPVEVFPWAQGPEFQAVIDRIGTEE